MRHIEAVHDRIHLEIGFVGDIGGTGLTAAIIEALEKGKVLEEAGILYIKAESATERFSSVDIWAPDPEEKIEPPPIPEEPDEPELNI